MIQRTLVLAFLLAVALMAESRAADLLQVAAAAFPDAVRIKHLYAGPDGESHLDELDLPRVGGTPGRSVQTRLYATDIEIGTTLPGGFIDFHGVTTPRLLIVLQGAIEIGLGDGSKHILHKGDMVLAADTTGHGHTSRHIGTEPVLSMTVRLPKEDSLKPKVDSCAPGTPAQECVAANRGKKE
jgi:hypothetical protein